jgi:hypothetical protein
MSNYMLISVVITVFWFAVVMAYCKRAEREEEQRRG